MNVESRKPLWLALSNFYLDTELQESDFRHVASVIHASPYSLEDAKEINKYEVFPVLQVNLQTVAGVWTGFDEDWLIDKIIRSAKKRNAIRKLSIECYYWVFKRMHLDYWEKLEKIYREQEDR